MKTHRRHCIWLLVHHAGHAQIYLITSSETPKDTLTNKLERETLANNLKKIFLQGDERRNLWKHLKEMKEISDKLASIGAPIEEKDQVVIATMLRNACYCT